MSLEDIKKIKLAKEIRWLDWLERSRRFYFPCLLNWLDVWAPCRNWLPGTIGRTFLFIVHAGFWLGVAITSLWLYPSHVLVLTVRDFFNNRTPRILLRALADEISRSWIERRLCFCLAVWTYGSLIDAIWRWHTGVAVELGVWSNHKCIDHC